MGKIRILFNAWADQDNTNAQSLNARDIAVRLDPHLFESAFFSFGEPKPELKDQPQIKIIKIPRRLGSLVMAVQMAWGSYDLLYYPPFGRQRKLFWILNLLGKKRKTVAPIEATAQQILATPPSLHQEFLQVLSTSPGQFAIGPYIAESMEKEFGLRMQVIPLGVDTEAFSFIDRRNHMLPVKILYIGTIQPRKQVQLMLDLAKQINPRITEFHIVGYPLGDLSYYEMLLKRKAEEEGLSNVLFHGKIRHSEIINFLKDCDILVLPSRLEGVPKVTLEAAATGMPCIIFADYHSPSWSMASRDFRCAPLRR